MNTKKMVASLLVGAATLIGTVLPATPALASNNNQALNMMAMQMYMQQQANAQQQAILAQEQAQATYNAAQAAWGANTVPQTTVSYCAPQSVYSAPVYNQPVYEPGYAPVVGPVVHAIDHIAYDISRDFGHHVEFRGRR